MTQYVRLYTCRLTPISIHSMLENVGQLPFYAVFQWFQCSQKDDRHILLALVYLPGIPKSKGYHKSPLHLCLHCEFFCFFFNLVNTQKYVKGGIENVHMQFSYTRVRIPQLILASFRRIFTMVCAL